MGSVGDSYDNALAENLWMLIKTECIRGRTFSTRAEANLALFEYIDGFYNPRRIQKRLGYLSPIEFEEKHYADQATTEPVNLKPRQPAPTSAAACTQALRIEAGYACQVLPATREYGVRLRVGPGDAVDSEVFRRALSLFRGFSPAAYDRGLSAGLMPVLRELVPAGRDRARGLRRPQRGPPAAAVRPRGPGQRVRAERALRPGPPARGHHRPAAARGRPPRPRGRVRR
jgi:hypothetical protein